MRETVELIRCLRMSATSYDLDQPGMSELMREAANRLDHLSNMLEWAARYFATAKAELDRRFDK